MSADKSSVEEILDEAIEHDRLMRSFQLGIAPISSFGSLAFVRTQEITVEEKFFELIRLISSKEDGLAVALVRCLC